MSMLITCTDASTGRPINGILEASAGDEVTGVSYLDGPATMVSRDAGIWQINRSSIWTTPPTFPLTLVMAGAPVAYLPPSPPVMYADGGPVPVDFPPVPMAMPGAATDPLRWSDLDGRALPDGDQIVADTYPLRPFDPLFTLESGPEVDWWKSIYLFDPHRNVASLLCKTTGPGQTSRSVGLAFSAGPYTGPRISVRVPGGGVINVPLYGLSEWDVLSSNRLIFHKSKFLGTDTAIYSLEMSQAPHDVFERVGWRFSWQHQ